MLVFRHKKRLFDFNEANNAWKHVEHLRAISAVLSSHVVVGTQCNKVQAFNVYGHVALTGASIGKFESSPGQR